MEITKKLSKHSINPNDRVAGLVLGTAVGDALGLPREGLSRRRAYKLFGGRPIHNKLILNHGMVSDDTEHTCMVIQSLLTSNGDIEFFINDLARRFKLWLLGIPAGVGLATLKSILKLFVGFSPHKSGVYSAGNGPAMRSAILGVYAGKDIRIIKELVRVSTRITHTDPKAEDGAIAIALAAQYSYNTPLEQFDIQECFKVLLGNLSNADILGMLATIKKGLESNLSSEQMADLLGFNKGISGYIVHTVPIAIFCWLKNIKNFRGAIEDVILLGGDTDTTGAIVGALAGVTLGKNEIPREWLSGIRDFPLSIDYMEKLSWQLSYRLNNAGIEIDSKMLSTNFFSTIPRNIFFTIIVLLHGLRRLLPPY
jgi:ADP-ribosyl-[dinitrogen reductase] hydrolase